MCVYNFFFFLCSSPFPVSLIAAHLIHIFWLSFFSTLFGHTHTHTHWTALIFSPTQPHSNSINQCFALVWFSTMPLCYIGIYYFSFPWLTNLTTEFGELPPPRVHKFKDGRMNLCICVYLCDTHCPTDTQLHLGNKNKNPFIKSLKKSKSVFTELLYRTSWSHPVAYKNIMQEEDSRTLCVICNFYEHPLHVSSSHRFHF